MIFKPVKATDWDPSLKTSLKLLNMSTAFTVAHLPPQLVLPPTLNSRPLPYYGAGVS